MIRCHYPDNSQQSGRGNTTFTIPNSKSSQLMHNVFCGHTSAVPQNTFGEIRAKLNLTFSFADTHSADGCIPCSVGRGTSSSDASAKTARVVQVSRRHIWHTLEH